MAACSSEPPGPADATRHWFEAVARLDLAQVRALTCTQDQLVIDGALSTSGGFSHEVDLSGLQAQIQVDLSGLDFAATSVNNQEALVRVFGTLNGQPVDHDVELVMEGDAWKVCTTLSAAP